MQASTSQQLPSFAAKIAHPNTSDALMNPVPKNETIQAPILALDLGSKRVGLAVSDKLSISITRLDPLQRSSWKQLLSEVEKRVQSFDAQTLVIGFPLRLEGTEGSSALETRRTAEKFAQSLRIPVYLQDERLTSVEAGERLRDEGYTADEIERLVDSESAVVILRDFLQPGQKRVRVLHP